MSGKTTGQLPSKRELIADLRGLAEKNKDILITRNFYRGNGKFKEAHWQKYFSSFTHFLNASDLSPQIQEKTPPETNEIVGNQWTITLPKTRISTLDELLAYCKVDLLSWQVERFQVNKWEVGAKDDKGKLVVEPLFQVKATLVRRVQIDAIRKEIESLKEEAKRSARVPETIKRSAALNSGLMLEVNIPDIHLGKLAWHPETGYGNYDIKIAERTYREALDALLDRVKGYKFESVLYVIGNDMLNSDSLDSKTTRGTQVDTDGRYYKTFGIARRLVTECIEKLRLVAPVKVVTVAGNHDFLSAYHLGDSLECYFHKYSDVEIDNSPLQRKYHEFGQVLLGFQHGDKGKRGDFALVMATECPQQFGRTRYREIHTGHFHQTRVEEQHGVRVRILPALCPPDAWHSNSGYVANLASAEAFVWSSTEGLIAQHYYNSPIESEYGA